MSYSDRISSPLARLLARLTGPPFEGAAYAAALAAASVDARRFVCRGQVHSSVPSVGVIVSADAARAEIGTALRRFLAR